MALASLKAAGIVERDKDGDFMWVWSFPAFGEAEKQFALKKCCLTWDKEQQKKEIEILPFVYFQHAKQWFYIFSMAASEEETSKKITHFALILSAKDFNPEKYLALLQILSKHYDQSGSPVVLLEKYLKVLTIGSCQSFNNGTFKVDDYDPRKAYAAASLKDVVNIFGMESILIYCAVLLKKRILIHCEKLQTLLDLTRAIPALVWHRKDWAQLHPWLDDLEEVGDLPYYVGGTCTPDLSENSELYDVYVDVARRDITVASHARESLALGKIHKDIAKTMVELADDESVTEQQFIKAIDSKAQDLLTKLLSLGGDRGVVTLEEIKSKNFNSITENFLTNLAKAEHVLES